MALGGESGGGCPREPAVCLQGTARPALVLASAFFLCLWARRCLRTQHRGPPGPFAWPLLGNVLQLGRLPHLTFCKMAQRYGDVFQLQLGRWAVVVLNGEAVIRQALVRQGRQFAGRPDFPSFRLVSGGRSMAFGRYSQQWRAHRRLAHSSLRVFSTASGRSRRLLEQHVAAEAQELIHGFLRRGAGGTYFDPCPLFTVANANVICALCFGQRYSHDDDEFRALLGRNDKFGQTVGAGSLVDVMPWLQAFPNPVRHVFRDFQALNRELHDFIKAKVAQHRRTYDPRLTRDISDAVISEIEQGGGGLSRDYVEGTMTDIFGAGQDTTSTALSWVLLLLLKHPQLQHQLQVELDRVVGRGRLPTAEDRSCLPQLEAFIYETLRFSSFVPVTIPHATTSDVELWGFHIPKDTVVFVNQWSVNHDWRKWKDPHVFNPARFLDGEQKLDRDLACSVMIFSIGKRRCIGDQLSKLQIFLFTAILLHQCTFEANPAEQLTMDCIHGLALKPLPFTVSVKRRDAPQSCLEGNAQ